MAYSLPLRCRSRALAGSLFQRKDENHLEGNLFPSVVDFISNATTDYLVLLEDIYSNDLFGNPALFSFNLIIAYMVYLSLIALCGFGHHQIL
jgi:hypothetical protein